MKNNIEEVKEHYNENPKIEWDRLQKKHPYEKYITVKIMDKYIKDGDSILDIGGGPGHYSIHYALKGHDVTLFDLSDENIKFAKNKSRQYKTKLKAIVGNALDLSQFTDESFDIVFLMGPIYHLMDEEDRIRALQEAKRVLKKDGYLFTSFIMMYGGLIYDLRDLPKVVFKDAPFFDVVKNGKSLSFKAFTNAYMSSIEDSEKLINKIDGLKIVTEFSQEGILAPYMHILEKLTKAERIAWYDISYSLCERKEYLSHAEHLMIVSKKAK